MPLISQSTYHSPFWLFNGHLQTIFPALFYNGNPLQLRRQRFDTSDGDFVDVDWLENGSNKLYILSHGLEGNSHAPYIQRILHFLNRKGYDALAWNFRGCSGVPNRHIPFYHSGFTRDLSEIIEMLITDKKYEEIVLVGISIGGNITLKYLGDQGNAISPLIKKAIVFSVPCDLASGAEQLSKRSNWIYMRRFLASFKHKFEEKNRIFPGAYNMDGYDKIRNFRSFDSRYTAPLFGFIDVDDYYSSQSSKPFIPKIKVQTLIINAKNDPFLGSECYPVNEAQSSDYVSLEMPDAGGHAGFPGKGLEYWL